MDSSFIFSKEPTFAELWDVCVYNLLYQPADFKKDIEKIFEKLGVTKSSAIIDVAAGSGFPAIDLSGDGYRIVCADGFRDEVDLFNEKAARGGIAERCIKARWLDLGNLFPAASFDFLFCRGNSFIYASGGWNEMIEIEPEKSLADYRRTLSIFYNLLKPGGWIYLDKFKDSEITHRLKVCDIQVGDRPQEELLFWTQRFPDKKIRQASMIRKSGGIEHATPNITYDLSESELEDLLGDVGFKDIEKLNLPSEQNFSVWIAQK